VHSPATDHMLYDAARFEFTAALADNWQAIYREYLDVADRVIDWFERDLYGDGWKVFGLFDFPHGKPLPENTAACPLTTELVKRHVPRHGAVGFSVLRPGTRIQPHEGYAGNFLRCHLALRVPSGDCGLRIGGVRQHWHEGKMLIFDDRHLHEAWNMTGEDRVVLLLDFVPAADIAVTEAPRA
jgi:aspartyl/asparaginyl beta-hydroxylase (cupin superfamily)